MSNLTVAATTTGGLLLLATGAYQWRRRRMLTERSNRWFPDTDLGWQRTNFYRIRFGAGILMAIGALCVYAGVSDLLAY